VRREQSSCPLPLWVPDDAVLKCMVCRGGFNPWTKRRVGGGGTKKLIWQHHCRVCGRVCCDECSNNGKKFFNAEVVARCGGGWRLLTGG
jgi:hypothetical protein